MEPKTPMLAKQLKDNVVQCMACNWRCRIPEGQAGQCGVRANKKGKLNLIVYGKPVSIWADPVEKKPLFHFLPGTKSLSLGTLGCNFSCEFCFAPDSMIINDGSLKQLDEVFGECPQIIETDHAQIAVGRKKTITAKGSKKRILKVFRHPYAGTMLTIRPRHAPPVSCTPSHRFFVYRNGKAEKVAAGNLTNGDYLLIPKIKAKKSTVMLDCRIVLEKNISRIKKIRKLDEKGIRRLLKLSKSGKTSRQIAKIMKMHPVYLIKLLNDLKKSGLTPNTFSYDNAIVEKEGRIKFKMEKKDGIPKKLIVDEDFAELLGYYCAEGNTSINKDRPTSFNVVFSYGKKEKKLVTRTLELLKKVFGVKARTLTRRTTVTVEVTSSSLGTLLTALCGKKAKEKKVPSIISRSGKSVILAFMRAFIAGDGCIMKDSIAINTVSKKLAMGIYHLFLLLGYLPSFYEWKPPRRKMIEGRIVKQSTLYYVKLKAEKFREWFLGTGAHVPRKKSEENLKFKETKDHWLVPVFKIEKKSYSGPVYNCEVEGEHSYLANFLAVCNCQNWDISQAPHDAKAMHPEHWRDYFQKLVERCEDWPPEKLVELALQHDCKSISFTYNEPTIFTEYAIDTMELARKKGLKGIYVTNGYETKECWDRIRGYIDAANIDLKAYNQKFYTKLCHIPRFEFVKESIEYARKLGIWVEVTTLIIPGWNDNEDELRAEAEWLASVDPDMPWHVTAFHPDYKMLSTPPTPPEILIRAREFGKNAGIKNVYCGNVPQAYSNYETTFCPSCNKELITRYGMSVEKNDVVDGKCRHCKAEIAGVWK